VRPTSGNGRLLWHALGAETAELINQNVHVESVGVGRHSVRHHPDKKGKEIEIKLVARLRKNTRATRSLRRWVSVFGFGFFWKSAIRAQKTANACASAQVRVPICSASGASWFQTTTASAVADERSPMGLEEEVLCR
jgi:hypothetical protein